MVPRSFSSRHYFRGFAVAPHSVTRTPRKTASYTDWVICKTTTTTTATTKTNKTNKQTRKKRIFTSPDRLKICYLKVKRDNIDGYRRGSRKVLKCSGQKSLRKEEPWYPENLPKKQSYYYGKANIRKNCFEIKSVWTYWGYSMFYPLFNELNSSYQISDPRRQRF